MASPGDLDTSFSGDGKRVIGFGGDDSARAVVAASQSRILVAGRGGPTPSFCIARLRSDGVLDTTFGSAGKVRIDVGGEVASGQVARRDLSQRRRLAGADRLCPRATRVEAATSGEVEWAGGSPGSDGVRCRLTGCSFGTAASIARE